MEFQNIVSSSTVSFVRILTHRVCAIAEIRASNEALSRNRPSYRTDMVELGSSSFAPLSIGLFSLAKQVFHHFRPTPACFISLFATAVPLLDLGMNQGLS
jgi:hypothetical protein